MAKELHFCRNYQNDLIILIIFLTTGEGAGAVPPEIPGPVPVDSGMDDVDYLLVVTEM